MGVSRHVRRPTRDGPVDALRGVTVTRSNGDLIGAMPTKIFLAILAGDTHGPSLARRFNLARSTCQQHLERLRSLGLIDWTEGKQGTIHPLVITIASSPRKKARRAAQSR